MVAVEELHVHVRLQTGRKRGTSLLSCRGLDLLVSHCEPGTVVSCESHGDICSKSRTSVLHFCGKCCYTRPTTLSSGNGECCYMFNMWTLV